MKISHRARSSSRSSARKAARSRSSPAVERALPGEAEPERAAGAAPDWNARLRSLAGRRAEPDAFSSLAREYGELPAEAAGEDEALARYRAALVREMRAVLLDLCRGLERCNAPADRKQYAENALRRLDVLSAGGGLTPYELSGRMTWRVRGKSPSWADFPLQQKWFAVGEAVSHLERLQAEGSVKRVLEDGVAAYYPA